MQDYWHRQEQGKPLFPDLLWSRPETKSTAGKLLIIGGNAHGFAAAAETYGEASKAGIGTARVLLPDSLQKTVGKVFEAGEYAPSTPSGSFSQKAMAELLAMSQWADGVLLAGDFGRNSETAILLEQFSQKYEGQLTITQDALEYFTKSPTPLLNRENSLLVASFAQAQKLAMTSGFTKAFTFDMDMLRLVETLHEFSEKHPAVIMVKHLETVFVAAKGKVSSTKVGNDPEELWRVKTAAHAAVWWLQNPTKTLQALSSATLEAAPQ